jgi:hypothetical protein
MHAILALNDEWRLSGLKLYQALIGGLCTFIAD